jgi:LAS superfamily LD-carboxypeptidase LdcB
MKKFLTLLFLTALTLLGNAQIINKEELLGKINPSQHPSFSKIEKVYTTKDNIYLRTECYEAFIKMSEAAKKEGVTLTIISATRTFDQQKAIWERKWAKLKEQKKSDLEMARNIMLYSSMPGTSRHHWGTDIDINSLENSYFKSGAGKKLYDWMLLHAAEFGFHQTYTDKSKGRTGYEEEKWHWSYMPLSGPFLEEYQKQISYSDISGFSGSNVALELKVIETYVQGIE